MTSAASPDPSLPPELFRVAARAFLDSILARRSSTSAVTVMGAGNDVDDGRQFLARMGASGWSAPTWPSEFGGQSLNPVLVGIWQSELAGYEEPQTSTPSASG